MNAPLTFFEAEAIASMGDFQECCEQQAWFFSEGWIPLSVAVDNLQWLAERWALIDFYGQDTIQDEIAGVFAVVRGMTPPLPDDYAAQLVRQWEMDDPRDSWRHTGEPQPDKDFRNSSLVPALRREHYRTPQCTLDAFWFVVRNHDTNYLARWLEQHRADAAYLNDLWNSKCPQM